MTNELENLKLEEARLMSRLTQIRHRIRELERPIVRQHGVRWEMAVKPPGEQRYASRADHGVDH